MRPGPTMSLQAIALLGAAALCAFIANAIAREARHLAWTGLPAAATVAPEPPASPPTPTQPASPAAVGGGFPADPSQPIRDIHAEEAKTLFGAQAPFLDARRSEDYIAGHIAGAWRMPVWESDVDSRITEFEAARKPASADPLVLYCNGGDCEDSQLLASKLLALGYRNLLVYRDGYPDWVQRKQPVRKGVKP